jgi:hypothetical protein
MTIGDEPLEAVVELGGRHLQEINFFFLQLPSIIYISRSKIKKINKFQPFSLIWTSNKNS